MGAVVEEDEMDGDKEVVGRNGWDSDESLDLGVNEKDEMGQDVVALGLLLFTSGTATGAVKLVLIDVVKEKAIEEEVLAPPRLLITAGAVTVVRGCDSPI